MGIEESLRAALMADSTVTALVGERVYAGTIPNETTPTPWVYFVVSGEEPGEELTANASQSCEVEMHLWAETYAECRGLKRAVRNALDRFQGGAVKRCLWDGSDHDGDDDGHHITERYRVWADGNDYGSGLTWGPQYLVWGL